MKVDFGQNSLAMLDKKSMSKQDIRRKYITPAIERAGRDTRLINVRLQHNVVLQQAELIAESEGFTA